MIYDFALEPELVATWSDRAVAYPVLCQMGLGHRRVPCIFPSAGWRKLVMRAFEKSLPQAKPAAAQSGKKKMEVLLLHLHQNATRRSGRCSDTESWLGAATREHSEFPFGGILVRTGSSKHAHVIAADQLSEKEHPVWSPTASPVIRQSVYLAAALAPLLRSAQDLRFVDPHFDPEDSTYFEPMKAYLKVAQKRRSVGDLKLQIHFAIGPQQVEQQARLGQRRVDDRALSRDRLEATERTLRPLLDRRVEVRVFAWTQGASGRMHNRYVLSDVGGVALQTGLDQYRRDSARTDDLTILSKEQYAARWAEFAPEGTTYRLLGDRRFFGGIGVVQ